MKTISKLFGMILFAATLFSFSASAATMVGDSNTDLGKYWVKKSVTPVVVNGNELETYVIHYNNLEQPVYVGVLKEKKCVTYIVKSDGIELVYTCKNGKFGIDYMPKNLATLPSDNVKAKINRQKFLYQRVITQTPADKDTHLGLIASYFPEVVL